MGTVVLIGPARWILDAIHAMHWNQRAENYTFIAVIAAFVIVSFKVTQILNRAVFNTPAKAVRYAIPIFFTVVAAATAYAWSDPGRMLAGLAGGATSSVATAKGAIFEFGSYPDRDKLIELKKQGITSIISLQHPSVVIERQGIEAEDQAARELHINIIHLPMLPWVSENQGALDSMRHIAKTATGKFYVHCGLGRDRVNVVKRAIELLGAKTIANSSMMKSLSLLDRVPNFERGALFRLSDSVWLIPYPNKHEMFGYILQGEPAHVLLVLDPRDPSQKLMRDSAIAVMKQYSATYSELPFTNGNLKPASELVRSIRQIHGKVTVIVPATPWEDGRPRPAAEAAIAVMKAWGFTGRATTRKWQASDTLLEARIGRPN